jgi:hypothetical protein
LSHEEQPPYPDPALAAGRRLAPQRADVLVPGVNHDTIGRSGHGAEAAADVIRDRSAVKAELTLARLGRLDHQLGKWLVMFYRQQCLQLRAHLPCL